MRHTLLQKVKLQLKLARKALTEHLFVKVLKMNENENSLLMKTHQSWREKASHRPVDPAPRSSGSQCTWARSI